MNLMNYKAAVIGLGFVGGSMFESFKLKGVDVVGYDKFKNGGIGSFEECLQSDFCFLALPTVFDETRNSYDKDPIHEVCGLLAEAKYAGIVVIKSTVEPETTEGLATKYGKERDGCGLKFVHNPEFLTARTAFEDFHNQKHVVLGGAQGVEAADMERLKGFFEAYYPDAEISLCSATESESMKIFVNCFYSVKIQFFNELYLLCQAMGSECDYGRVKELMLKNGWINPMHTDVPGPDGKLSYGGLCFPKDTNALCHHMKMYNTPCEVLKATINERNLMRDDHDNCKGKGKKE